MLINGKFVRDWDRSRIGIWHTPVFYRHAEMNWEACRLQDWILHKRSLWGFKWLIK